MPTIGVRVRFARTAAAAALAASLLLGACGAKTKVPSVPTNLLTNLPSFQGTPLNSGTIHLELSGSIEGTYDLPLIAPSVYDPPPGGGSLSFADTESNIVGIGGVLQPGKTSSSLVVTVTVSKPDIVVFISEKGECTVQIAKAGEAAVEGSFECTDLLDSGGGNPSNITGTFEATA